MSISGYLDKTHRFHSNLIPPEIGKGELVTGGRIIDPARRQYLESVTHPNDIDKIVLPAGEDGSVLQADSTTNTGLKWVPHEPVAMSLRKSVNSIVHFLKPMIQERIVQDAERLNSESRPKIFIKTHGVIYTIPFDSTKSIQSVVDYLDEMYLFSLMNGCSRVKLVGDGKELNPLLTLGDYNIQNESTLYVSCVQQGGFNRNTPLHSSANKNKITIKKK